MLTRQIDGIDTPLSVVIHGSMALMAMEYADAFPVLDAAFEAGINGFDTAHIYAGPTTSVDGLLGEWVASRDVRNDVVIIAKGCHPGPPDWTAPRVSPGHLAADLGESLDRMDGEYVDLWLFHRDDPAVPVGELVDAANAEIAAGRMRAWGVSNWTTSRVRAAVDYADNENKVGPAANSAHYSLADQVAPPWDDVVTLTGPAAAEDRRWHTEQDLPVLAWSTLCGGFLSPKVGRDDLDEAAEGHLADVARCYSTEANWGRRQRADEVAARIDSDLSTVAVAWLLQSDLHPLALTGAASIAEVRHNAAAAELELSPADHAYIAGAS